MQLYSLTEFSHAHSHDDGDGAVLTINDLMLNTNNNYYTYAIPYSLALSFRLTVNYYNADAEHFIIRIIIIIIMLHPL